MLKIGDKVKMNNKYYVSEQNKEKVFTVKTEPKEVCGTMSVWLDGLRGCYAVDGLTKIDHKPTNADRIRAMSDEELENLLNKAVFCGGLVRSEQTSAECKGCSYPFCSPERYAEWLKREIDLEI